MRAVTYQAPGDLRVERVPDPELLAPTDAVVAVSIAAICGSDLHVWHGRERGLDAGTIMGHEFLGTVVEVGAGVSRLRPGDRVVSPFTTSCGTCFYCDIGLSARCTRGQLFGWVESGAGLHGGQAELVRVPLADSTLVSLPRDLTPEAGLVLGDVLATGYHCATLARVGPGTVAAVVGLGPVGLMAVLAARELGAGRVFAIDSVPERRELAARMGAEPIPLGEGTRDLLREATGGRGPDSVLEAVGTEGAARLAFDLVRPGGTIGAVGVHHEAAFPFSPGQAYAKNLTVSIGRCPARHYMERLIPVAVRHQAHLRSLFTHRVGLEDAPAAYRTFDAKADGHQGSSGIDDKPPPPLYLRAMALPNESISRSPMLLLSGTANKPLADEVAKELGASLCKTTIRRFADGEIFVKIDENVRGRDVYIIQPTNPPAENLIELLLLMDAARRASAARITPVIPYFGYARQDRKDQPRVAISAKLMANIISQAGADRVLAIDFHQHQLQGFFDLPVDHLYSAPVFTNHYRQKGLRNLAIVASDVGGAKMARGFAKRLDATFAIIDKRRTAANVAEAVNVVGDVEGRDCIIPDDMIDTGGTMAEAAFALKKLGAGDIYICATHALLSGPAVERLKQAPITEVAVTNTIHIPAEKQFDKLKVLSIAGLLAKAIGYTHSDQSVSALFD